MPVQLQTKTVEFSNEEITARLVISRANREIGFRRAVMQHQAREANKDEIDPTRGYMRQVLWPDMIAPVIEASLVIGGEPMPWPPTFEQYASMPECDDLDSLWWEAVYEVNPAWSIARKPKEEVQALEKKSVGRSTNGQRPTSRRRKTTAPDRSPTST